MSLKHALLFLFFTWKGALPRCINHNIWINAKLLHWRRHLIFSISSAFAAAIVRTTSGSDSTSICVTYFEIASAVLDFFSRQFSCFITPVTHWNWFVKFLIHTLKFWNSNIYASPLIGRAELHLFSESSWDTVFCFFKSPQTEKLIQSFEHPYSLLHVWVFRLARQRTIEKRMELVSTTMQLMPFKCVSFANETSFFNRTPISTDWLVLIAIWFNKCFIVWNIYAWEPFSVILSVALYGPRKNTVTSPRMNVCIC